MNIHQFARRSGRWLVFGAVCLFACHCLSQTSQPPSATGVHATFGLMETDTNGLSRVQYFRDNFATNLGLRTQAPFAVYINSRNIPDGLHRLDAVVTRSGVTRTNTWHIFVDNQLPPPVTGLTVEPGGLQDVLVSWDAMSGGNGAPVTGYHLFKTHETNATIWLATVREPQRSYLDSGAALGRNCYSARCFDAAGNNSPGNAPVCLQVLPPLLAPSNLIATALSTNSILLEWTLTDPNTEGVIVERALSSNGPWQVIAVVPTNSSSHVDRNLPSGASIYYKVNSFADRLREIELPEPAENGAHDK